MFSKAISWRTFAWGVFSLLTLFRSNAFADIEFINGGRIELRAPALSDFSLDLNTLLAAPAAGPITWALQGDKPTWLTLDQANSKMFGKPGIADVGTKVFSISAKPNGDDGARGQVTFTIFAVPVWADTSLLLNAKEDTEFNFDLKTKVTNPQGGALTFALKDPSGHKPAWLIGPTTSGVFTGTPVRKDVGTSDVFQVIARTELGGESTVDVRVQVAKTIKPPKFTKRFFTLDTAFEDAPYVQAISGTTFVDNQEAAPLTFTLKSATASGWLKLSPQGTFTGTPVRSDKGAVTVIAELATTIEGIQYKDEATFNFEVKLVNKAPVWSRQVIELPDAPARIIYSQVISTFASDIDGDKITFKIESGPQWASIGLESGTITGTPQNSDLGSNEWKISASDGMLSSVVTVRANVINRAPSWKSNPVLLTKAKEDSEYRQSLITQTQDPEGDALEFNMVSGPDWLTVSKDGLLVGTPRRPHLGLNKFRVSITDGFHPAVEAELQVEVERTNKPPQWSQNPVVLKDAPERSAYAADLAPFASDPDPGALKFSKVSGPTWVTIATNGGLIGTPLRADVGPNEIKVKVTDPEGLSADVTVQIAVLKVNRVPMWTQNPIQLPSALEDAPYTFRIDNLVTDADSDPLKFTKIAGPAWLILAQNGAITGTPSDPDVGDFQATFEVTDGEAKVQVPATGKVNRKNYAPVIKQPIALTVKERATLTVKLGAAEYVTDINNDPLTFKLTTAKSWATLSAAGDLVLKPVFSDIGVYNLDFEVSDGTLTSKGTLGITVLRDPRAPQWTENPIAFSTRAREAFKNTIAAKAKDLDNLPLTFSKVSGPDWLTISAAGELTGTPQDSDLGANKFVVAVANDKLSAQADLTVTVGFKNHPPVLNTDNLKFTVKERATFTESLAQARYVTDVDANDKFSFTITPAADWMQLTAAGALTLKPLFATIGEFDFKLTVSDGTDSVTSNMHVTVVRDPRAPVWSEKPVRYATKARLPFTANLNDKVKDLDKLPLTFTKKSGPTWLTIATDGKMTGTPMDEQLGDNTFVVTASNDKLSADSDLIVSVVFNNRAPAWTKDPIELAKAEAEFAYTASVAEFATDPDSQDQGKLVISKESGPAWVTVAANGTLSGTPKVADVGTTTLKVRVTDLEGLFATATVRIVVGPANQLPVWSREPVVLTDATAEIPYTFDLKPLVSDPDKYPAPLTLRKVNGPAWFDLVDGVVTGTPAPSDIGNFTAVFEAYDGRGTKQVAALGKVVRNNKVPVVHADKLAFTVKERQTLDVNLADPALVSDADGDALKFKMLDTRDWLTVTEAGKLTGKPVFKDIGDHTLNFQVTDGLATVSGVMKITVVRDPRPPVWSENPVKFSTKARVAFTAALSTKVKDQDGLPLTFAKKSGPDWLTIGTDGKLTGTAMDEQLGDNKFVVTASNDKLSADVDLIVSVVFNNRAPTWTKDPIDLAKAEAEVAYTASVKEFATDPDSQDQAKLVFSKESGPAWVTITSNGAVTGTPKAGDVGTATLRVRVTDLEGLFATATVRIVVGPANQPPRWSREPIVLTDATAEVPYTFDLKPFVTDPDKGPQALTLRKVNGPAWFELVDGVITGTPAVADIGNFTAVFEASDGRGTTQVAALGRVLRNNKPPVINADALVFSIKERQIFSVDLSTATYVTDPDGDALKFTLLDARDWLTLTEAGKMNAKPVFKDIGEHLLKFEVTDGSAKVQGVMKITVLRDPRAPQWSEDPIRMTAKAGKPFESTLVGKVRDLDGLPLVFTRGSGPDWLTIGPDGKLSGNPEEVNVGANQFMVTAANDQRPAQALLIVTVESANGKPVWSMNPVKLPNGRIGKSYSESLASYVKDPDGDTLSFEKLSGPAWAFITTSGVVIGIPEDRNQGPNAFTVRAKDSKGAFADAEVQIFVDSSLNPPVWKQDPVRLGEIPVDQVFNFDLAALASDPDGDTLTFRKVAGPAWLNLSTIGLLSGVPKTADLGEFTAVFEVSDGRNTAHVGAFGKVIPSNKPPVILADALHFTVEENQTFEANLSDPKYVSDPDKPLKFVLSAASEWLSLAGDGKLSIRPKRPQIGDHQFGFVVTDSQGASAQGTMFVTVTKKTDRPEWLENPLRFTANVDQAFGVSIASKVRDPLGGTVRLKKKSGPDWLIVYSNGGLSGVPRIADVGENTFVVTATNADGDADVTVLITVKRGGPAVDSWAVDEAVPGAPVENLWVIDNSWRWNTRNLLIESLKQNIGLYFRALEQARVEPTGVYLSSDVVRHRALPVRDPATGEMLLLSDDPAVATGFNRRVNASLGGQCETSPTWAMFKFYEQLAGLAAIYPEHYFKKQVPTEAMIVTRQIDMYRSYTPRTAQASWTPWEFADNFIARHQKAEKTLRISAVAPGCSQLMDPQDPREPAPPGAPIPVNNADNPYRILTKKTNGTYYTFDCNIDMRKVLTDYADKTIFRAYVTAKKRVKLSKTPSDVATIKVRIGGVDVPGNTSNPKDKWYYDSETNEVVIRWYLIDISVLKSGDRIEVHYQG